MFLRFGANVGGRFTLQNQLKQNQSKLTATAKPPSAVPTSAETTTPTPTLATSSPIAGWREESAGSIPILTRVVPTKPTRNSKTRWQSLPGVHTMAA